MRFIRYCCLCWLAFACTEDGKGDGSNAVLLSPAQSTYTAACQRDTLQFEAEGAWSVVADSPWVTLELAEGKGDGAVPLYIQQNDVLYVKPTKAKVRSNTFNTNASMWLTLLSLVTSITTFVIALSK